MWLLLRFAPAHPGPHRWISFGSALCVIAWVGTSLVFGLYVTQVADYNSIFGSLATVFVLLSYLYVVAPWRSSSERRWTRSFGTNGAA